MNRFKRALATTTAIIVCLAILATPIWLYFVNEYAKEHGLVSLNIYPVEPINDYRSNHLTIHYMICRPAETEAALKEQIDTYLGENAVVETINKSYKLEGSIQVLTLYFIRPTDHWPIGKVTTEQDGNVGFQGEQRLCSITIDWAAGGTYQYEFFPENFEAKE